jgi:tRNA (adenine57-N1/adenine58-N1)-methyltransferase
MAKIIYNPKTHEKLYVDDSRLKKEFHSKFGIIYEEELQKNGKIESHNGTELCVFDANFKDKFTNLKRQAQIITLKDASVILSETGLTKDSVVYDSGSGSGGLACFLGKFVKKVFSFDIREDHFKIAKNNAEKLNLDNISFSVADVYDPENFSESCVADVFTLDVPESEKAINTVDKILKIGGYVVAYTPQLLQAKTFVKSIKLLQNFEVISVKEILHQSWDVFGKKSKPLTSTVGHTGFLVFARKLY